MNLTHFFLFLNNFMDYFIFLKNAISFVFFSLRRNFFFFWKISNFADSYWFFYSNKKSTFELRYF